MGDICCMVSTGRVIRWKYWHIQDSGWCARTTLGRKRVALLCLNNPQARSPQPSSYLSYRRNYQTHLLSSTRVWVFTTATCLLIASSVWELTVNNSRTLNTRRILVRSDLQAGVCVKKSRESVPFTLFDDVPSDLRDRPEVGSKMSSTGHSKCALLV